MNKLKLFGVLIAFSGALTSFGQDEGKWKVEKSNKKIILPEATRNYDKVTVETPQTPTEQQNYEIHDVDINLPKLTTKINVAKMGEDKLKKLYGNYIKAGFGNYTTPYLEAFFNNKRSEKLGYGLHLKHFSSTNGPVKNSGLSQNQGDAYLRYFGKSFVFTSGLNYNANRYNYYGYNHELNANKDTLKHSFHTFALNAGIKSINPEATLTYNLNVNYYNFGDNLKASENEFLITDTSRYKIDSDRAISADGILSISSRKDSGTVNRALFQIRPAYVLTQDKYKVIAGFNLAYTNDTAFKSSVHLYPRVHAEYAVVPGMFGVFGGIDGGMQKNTLRSFTYQNPYLRNNVPLSQTNKAFEIYGGAQGNVSGLNYRAKLSYGNYKNLYLFNNSFTDTSRFTVLYDKSANVLNLEGDLGYELTETFRVGLNLNYFNYGTTTFAKAYHRPNFITRLSATYNLYKKIYFNADIYYISGLYGRNFISKKDVALPTIVDLNLKLDYRVSNVFSAFIEANNLLNQKYQRYLYYPVKGINVIAGIAYSF
jgi:hypothetical protein